MLLQDSIFDKFYFICYNLTLWVYSVGLLGEFQGAGSRMLLYLITPLTTEDQLAIRAKLVLPVLSAGNRYLSQ